MQPPARSLALRRSPTTRSARPHRPWLPDQHPRSWRSARAAVRRPRAFQSSWPSGTQTSPHACRCGARGDGRPHWAVQWRRPMAVRALRPLVPPPGTALRRPRSGSWQLGSTYPRADRRVGSSGRARTIAPRSRSAHREPPMPRRDRPRARRRRRALRPRAWSARGQLRRELERCGRPRERVARSLPDLWDRTRWRRSARLDRAQTRERPAPTPRRWSCH